MSMEIHGSISEKKSKKDVLKELQQKFLEVFLEKSSKFSTKESSECRISGKKNLRQTGGISLNIFKIFEINLIEFEISEGIAGEVSEKLRRRISEKKSWEQFLWKVFQESHGEIFEEIF